MTKEEILAQMKVHQSEYSKLNEEYKRLKTLEEKEFSDKRQLARLEEFRTKYKFYAHMTAAPEPINWDNVAEAIQDSLKTGGNSALGWDETGMPVVSMQVGYNVGMYALVETEDDAKKYVERELKRQEIAARKK
jgi:hypothetical protein